MLWKEFFYYNVFLEIQAVLWYDIKTDFYGFLTENRQKFL